MPRPDQRIREFIGPQKTESSEDAVCHEETNSDHRQACRCGSAVCCYQFIDVMLGMSA